MPAPLSQLPLGLLDLTLTRTASASHASWRQIYARTSIAAARLTTNHGGSSLSSRRSYQHAAALAPSSSDSGTSAAAHFYGGEHHHGVSGLPASSSSQGRSVGRRAVKRTSPGMMLAPRKERALEVATELDKRVQSLQVTASQTVDGASLTLTEAELETLYEDLLALSEVAEEKGSRKSVAPGAGIEAGTGKALVQDHSRRELDAENFAAVCRRFLAQANEGEEQQGHASSSSFVDSLRSMRTTQEEQSQHLPAVPSIEFKNAADLISRLENIASRLEAAARSTRSSSISEGSSSAPSFVGLGLVSETEWTSLVRHCVSEDQFEAAEQFLQISKKLGASASNWEQNVDIVLNTYARQGNTDAVDRFIEQVLQAKPTELQRDRHVKAYIVSASNSFPTTALSVLHNYESTGTPTPMRTYTRLMTALFAVPHDQKPTAHAHAWDLFSHMRYVAHPNPDALLYTLMIRACASSPVFPAEPERAIDLWTEMTVDRGLAPTQGGYDAVITACARSGRREYVNEAFRLAREMLDAHRDARGRQAFVPTQKTFLALLDGAKRIGDLGRCRWILAEIVKGSGSNHAEQDGVTVTAEVMMHVFHAYAAYKPPFKRGAAPLVDSNSTAAAAVAEVGDGSAAGVDTEEGLTAENGGSSVPQQRDNAPSFSHIPPQSHSEVIGEARALFERIVDDKMRMEGAFPLPSSSSSSRTEVDPLHHKFAHVKWDGKLLNAYLAVYHAHATLASSRNVFDSVFEYCGVVKTERSIVEALERCARARPGEERILAHQWAQELWREWEALQGEQQYTKPMNARMTERAWAAMIRVLALAGDIARAMDYVRSFASRYPPMGVKQPGDGQNEHKKPVMRSTRTMLLAEGRPLVHLTTSAVVPDAGVPPLLTFENVELLHHRLVALAPATSGIYAGGVGLGLHAAAGRGAGSRWRKEIAYLKWLCKAYEGNLRARRGEVLTAEAEEQETIPVVPV